MIIELNNDAARISIHVPLAGNVPCALQGKPTIAENFYPRSPCGERPNSGGWKDSYMRFLSTFPLRGTSIILYCLSRLFSISIHVPLAGNVAVGGVY